MNILISYANEKYKGAQKQNTWTGKHIAKFDKIYQFGPEDIDEEYRERHSEILSTPRGNGLWLWKPYFISKVLEEAQEGDIVFYCDSGALFISSMNPIFEIINREEIFVTDYPLLEMNFTKDLCFKVLGCDSDEYKMSNQFSATYMGFKCSLKAKRFVSEWLNLCEQIDLIVPENNQECVSDNIYQFVSHREDQSLLSLLCKQKGINPHRDITQRGKMPYTYYNRMYAYMEPKHDDSYGTILFSHKMQKFKIRIIMKYALLCYLKKKEYKKYRTNRETV